MTATSVNTGKDRTGQFYQDMTTKGRRVVKWQHKLHGNNPAKSSCCEVPRNVAKVNFAPSLSWLRCRKFALKAPEATRGGISEIRGGISDLEHLHWTNQITVICCIIV